MPTANVFIAPHRDAPLHPAPAGPPAAAVADTRGDEVLVAAALADRTAFAPLYLRHVDAVYRYCRGQLRDPDAAAEATANTFADALVALPRFRGDGPFGAWLIGIARRKVADHWRHHRRLIPLAARPDAEQATDRMAGDPGAGRDAVEAGRLAAALAALPPRERDLVAMRFGAGLPFAEIGTLTGRSEAATKMALRRVLDRLAAALDLQETSR